MRILVLGATGRVAGQALALLADAHAVDHLVMAGRERDRVSERRAELGIAATVVEADATDADQVARAAAGCDVVLNLAGLDDVTPVRAAAGALRAGSHYVDIAASPSSVRTLLEQSVEFEAAGLTCIPSSGTAPGLSGMLGCHAASQLDECEVVTINLGVPLARWGDPVAVAASHRQGAPVLQSHAAIVAWFTRPAPVVREGLLTMVRPAEHLTLTTSPDGRSYRMLPIGSTEALTVPLAVRDVRRVESLCALWPDPIMELIAAQANDVDLEDATRSIFAELATWDPEHLKPPSHYPESVFWAQADGRRSGRPRSVCCTNAVSSTTAGIAATTAILVGSDDSIPRGVHPPEVCFEITDFLNCVCDTQRIARAEVPVAVHTAGP